MAVVDTSELSGGPAATIALGTLSRSRLRLRNALRLWLPLGVLIFIVAACFIWPYIYPLPSPDTPLGIGAMPLFASGHLLGTDDIGRDMLSRSLYGGQVSIVVGVSSVAIGFVVGGGLGMFAGYIGGVTDVVISRILDMFLAFPALVLALAVAAFLGPSEHNEILAISFFTIPGYGRFARAATLRLREEEFLSANRMLGGKTPYIIYRHVLPNIIGTLLTFGLLAIAGAMLAEAALSFLGAGIRPPAPSWGNMIAEGEQFLSTAPHIVFVPAAFLFVTVLSLNFLGDAVRERFHV